jgi:anaerobic dimethyl sulfoxide reductase subunit A
MLTVHVRDGVVERIVTDSLAGSGERDELRACLRGRGYRDRLYHPERLKYPLKRTGSRGEGRFARISWAEATDIIAAEIKRITEAYGPQSRFLSYCSGNMSVLSERAFFRRLLSVYGGGFLNYHNSYSTACTKTATEYTYGTAWTGSSRDNWQYARLIILWGHNPAETTFGTNTSYYLKQAKSNGAKIIVIDPRYSDTAVALADEWIPIRPTTDNALMDAMIYVMITEKLYDRGFVEKYCLGFDQGQMPADIPAGHSLSSYILGESDGVAKTPGWAEAITKIPAQTICRLAREYATVKPAALIQGWGPQRHAYGEQPARGATVLAAITGNVGILGGWASGTGFIPGIPLASVPYENPVQASIPVFIWPDAVLRGRELGPADGLKNTECLASDIKLIANLAGNCLVNQHSDINSTIKILQDEAKCEFILVSDEFMTSTARFADVLLPATNFLERTDIIGAGDLSDDYVVLQNQAVEPAGECRNGYDWIREVAEKLGVADEFSLGKNEAEWLEYIIAATRENEPEFPDDQSFVQQGYFAKKRAKPYIAFQEQIEDFAANPFPTPSGKIEIFSRQLYEMNNPSEIPAIPRYIASWEGPEDPLREQYPLQLIGWHSKRSTHSVQSNSTWLPGIAPLSVWMNPGDARERGIMDGERVCVYNQRGKVHITAKVTPRIMPGVVAIPQGAWYAPDEKGVDQGGCINTLTRYQPTPLAKGNPQHTNLVEIGKITQED